LPSMLFATRAKRSFLLSFRHLTSEAFSRSAARMPRAWRRLRTDHLHSQKRASPETSFRPTRSISASFYHHHPSREYEEPENRIPR
jgi:hypothetical protein